MVRNRSRQKDMVVFIGLFALLWVSSSLAQAADANPAARVLTLKGVVSAEGATGVSRALQRGSSLYSHEVVVTGEGEVQLRFADGMMLTLYADTRFAIDEFHFRKDAGNAGDVNAQFRLLGGAMHTLSGTIGEKFRDRYRVKTELADLGIRGTEYSALLEKELMVTVHQGIVSMDSGAGSLLVRAGESGLVSGPGLKPRLTTSRIRLENRSGNRHGRPGPGGGGPPPPGGAGPGGGAPPPPGGAGPGAGPGGPTAGMGGGGGAGAPPAQPNRVRNDMQRRLP